MRSAGRGFAARAARRLRTSPAVARWLFGVAIEPPVDYLLWDFTTLVLKRALARHVRAGDTVLEMGVGPAAILSLSLARRLRVQVTAAEVCSEFVASARRQAARNAATRVGEVTIVESDLFQRVPGRYEVIAINPPYLPEDEYAAQAGAGAYDGLSAAAARSASSGGRGGTELIERFLAEAPAHLRPEGKILFGTNPRYVPVEAIAASAARHGLRHTDTVRVRWNPTRVLVLEGAAR